VLGLVLLVGCNQSLFDANGAVTTTGGTGDDAGSTGVASSCAAPCLADAAADFDGSPGGIGNRWRYLDDHRDRTWTAMAASATTMTGADPGNHITKCAAGSKAAACQALPGALLVSSAGAMSAADPALELTAAKAQVVKLSIRAFVPSGDDQTIRIYRNSREDLLYADKATAGTILEQAVTVDALPGDRFLVAVAPMTNGATDIGLQVFLNPTGAVFPQTCQVALSFAAAAGNTVDNLCGTDFTHGLFDADMDTAPVLAAGPFVELGTAADLPPDHYYRSTGSLDKTHDVTVQFWVKLRSFLSFGDAWVFSDLDFDFTGGLGIVIINDPTAPKIDVQTCTGVTPTTLEIADAATPYPLPDSSWQFVRVVHSNGNVQVCLNGVRKTSFVVPVGKLQSTYPPHLGSNVRWGPQGAFVDGEMDDVRVISSALPCDL
jgi:hypothetical protein